MGDLIIQNCGIIYGITDIEVMHGGQVVVKLTNLSIQNGKTSNKIHLEAGSYDVVVSCGNLKKTPQQVIVNTGKVSTYPVYQIP